MPKAVARQETNLPATNEDPYDDFTGRAAGQNVMFAKYEKGAFKYGPDDEVLPIGTELAANTSAVEAGWLKWHSGSVVEQRMTLISEGRYPYRDDLGDLDSRMWEVDETTGRPMDPWSETYTLPLRDLDTGQDFLFSTSSFGGRKAVGQVVYAWRHAARLGQKGVPIIALGTDSYRHKKYGTVHFPMFEIVRWADADSPADSDAREPEADAKAPDAKSKARQERAKLDEELNDDIPVML